VGGGVQVGRYLANAQGLFLLKSGGRGAAHIKLPLANKWDDALPSRSVTISADNEDEAVDIATQMGDAARIEFTRTFSKGP
jgi:hypothetical protein